MTGQEKISYIGHSQGTTAMFSALASNQDFWKERLNLFVAWAPVIIPNKDNLLFSVLSKNVEILGRGASRIKLWELFGANWVE